MGEIRSSLRERFDALSKSRLTIYLGLIAAGAILEIEGGDKSNIYMQLGGAAVIIAGASVRISKSTETSASQEEIPPE
jgi:hypothetical protein